ARRHPDADWCAGRPIAYLGGALILRLDTDRPAPERVGDELHLPLPPEASARQIRDAAESWLRDEALRIFQKSAPAGRRIVLSFGRHGDWVRVEGERLRCHWRLIEQPPHVIAQALARAALERPAPCYADLFAQA
ncbi:MAG: hypothetical protein N2690_05560, partial [Rhodocyclaceae bacterium]|nr:hypothetical protein [Rhodocyclaceae bacterium]